MSYAYHPDIAAKAVNELTLALRAFNDMEYANALLADSRMTNTKGLLASCGITYKGIKLVREQVEGHIPTLQAQRRALDFLGGIDTMQQQMERGHYVH
jgi:hypothetical protein